MNYDEAYMGQFLREYEPPLLSLNATLNYFLTRPVKMGAFASITMEVEFPDVSFWQEEIDYEIMATKTNAIIIRAGQNKWKDEQFERNYAEAKRKGLLVGVYWFYDGRASPGEQAELLISLLRGKKIDLEVYIDWEHNYGGAHEGLKNVVAMMEVVEQEGLDIKGVGQYTGYYFFRANSNPITNASQYNYLKTRPLWLAWYTSNPLNILIPAPWDGLNLWQWGTPAFPWGQQSLEIDMNFFNGTKQEFTRIYGTSGETPMADYVELKSNTTVARSVREQTSYPNPPHIFGAWKGSLQAGSFAKANPLDFYRYSQNVVINGETVAWAGDVWWKIYEINGQAISGWIAEIHRGEVLLNKRTVTTSPAPTLPTLVIEVSDSEGKYTPVTVELKPK